MDVHVLGIGVVSAIDAMVSAIRAIAKTPTGRNFAPKALGKTLVLR